MDWDYTDDAYPTLHYEADENYTDITNIYDFIERGYARETPNMFLEVVPGDKLKKCYFLVSEDKKEFRLFDGKTEELYLFAKFDEFDEYFKIYSYDKEETAFNFSAPLFKFQIMESKNHFVLWNQNCEKCDITYQKACSSTYPKIRQQLMFAEHFRKEMDDYKIHMLRVLIPNFNSNLKRQVWCPTTEKIFKKADNYNKDFCFRSVDWKMVEDKKIPTDSIYIRTKFPEWNEEEEAYMVDFNGRVKRKSTKNYQLMLGNDDKEKRVVFQFGKYSEKAFILDFMYPLCLIQAFSLGLLTYNWKTNS